MTIENAFHNKYSLVKGAARRARQLQSGASPLIAHPVKTIHVQAIHRMRAARCSEHAAHGRWS